MYYYLSLVVAERPKKQHLVILLVVNVMIIYAHYFGFMVLFVQFLFVLINRELRIKYWKHLLLFTAVVVLFYLPNIPVIINRFLDSSVNGTWVSPPNGIKDIYSVLRKFSNAPVVASIVIIILVAAIIKYVVKEKIGNVKLSNKLMLMWFVFPLLFMFFISYWIPMFLDRYLVFISGGFYLSVAISSTYLISTRKFSVVIPIIICCLFIASVKPNISNKRNVKEVVEKVKALKKENSLVIYPYNFALNFSYYYNLKLFKQLGLHMEDKLRKGLMEQHVYGVTKMSEVAYNSWEHIIYLDAATNFLYPNNAILEHLNNDYKLVSHSKIYEVFNVYEYQKK